MSGFFACGKFDENGKLVGDVVKMPGLIQLAQGTKKSFVEGAMDDRLDDTFELRKLPIFNDENQFQDFKTQNPEFQQMKFDDYTQFQKYSQSGYASGGLKFNDIEIKQLQGILGDNKDPAKQAKALAQFSKDKIMNSNDEGAKFALQFASDHPGLAKFAGNVGIGLFGGQANRVINEFKKSPEYKKLPDDVKNNLNTTMVNLSTKDGQQKFLEGIIEEVSNNNNDGTAVSEEVEGAEQQAAAETQAPAKQTATEKPAAETALPPAPAEQTETVQPPATPTGGGRRTRRRNRKSKKSTKSKKPKKTRKPKRKRRRPKTKKHRS